MTLIELISLIASIASLILAIGAIWLSIVFFKMSSEAAHETKEAAKGIDASVQRLEKLFDKLYSDTFSMMKDTVTDMRKHIWNRPDNDTTEVSEEMKKEIQAQVLSALDENVDKQPAQKEELAKKLESAFEEMLVKARNKKRAVKADRILAAIKDLGPISVSKLASALDCEIDDLAVPHLFELRKQGKITWGESEDMITSDSILQAVEGD